MNAYQADYARYRKSLAGLRLPLAFVDLDKFDRNIEYVSQTQRISGKTIRIATKSLRCVSLIKRIFDLGGESFRGCLGFTVEEAAHLIDHGLDDVVVAYPTVQTSDLDLAVQMTKAGNRIWLMADSLAHLEAISQAGRRSGIDLGVCLDVDMSYRPLGEKTHLGVRRSPLRTGAEVRALLSQATDLPNLTISGLMGYEAQVASVNDALPGQGLKNRVIRLIKGRSMVDVMTRRAESVRAMEEAGLTLEFVNGGGSGSLAETGQDPTVTEVAAGSAFFAPGLFHHFARVEFQPSAFFALQVVRKPKDGIVTLSGGGYVGSGGVGPDKLPVPVYPPGLKFLGLEGVGEVQTPVIWPEGVSPPDLGQPVIFQHAKAGELCERFNELHLIRGDLRVDTVPTYRGQGKAFL